MIEMVKFKECFDGEEHVNYGFFFFFCRILSGCCGSIIEAEPEAEHTIEILEVLPWIDISEAIKGD